MIYIVTAAALAASNYLYQAAGAQDWSTAFERSFFQASAVGIVALMLFITRRA